MFGLPDMWDASLPSIPAGWRVLAPEMPVFDGAPQHIGVPGLSRFIIERLDEQGIRQAVFGGNSLGGHVALQIALEHPERVSGLVLSGSSGLFERSIVNNVPRRPDRDWVRDRVREVFLDAIHVTEKRIDDVMAVLRDRRRALNLLKVAKSAKRTHLGPVLHRIKCPVLLVWGSEDFVTPPEVAREFKEYMPQSELHFIPECGHVPMIERPAEFGHLLNSFLRQTFAPPAHRPGPLQLSTRPA
jgi:pimeloyl-ACP methyl ester carboxylesterase